MDRFKIVFKVKFCHKFWLKNTNSITIFTGIVNGLILVSAVVVWIGSFLAVKLLVSMSQPDLFSLKLFILVIVIWENISIMLGLNAIFLFAIGDEHIAD